MGSFISYLWWGGKDPDQVDPDSGLSVRDIYVVRSTWTKISADGIASGSELLVRYFTAHPEYKKYFNSFKNMATEDLKSSRQFQAHSLNIIASLSQVVDNLDKPDLAAVMCKKLGSSHKRNRIQEMHFNDFKEILVKLFIDDLHFDEATMQSWVRTVTFIYKNIFSELDSHEK